MKALSLCLSLCLAMAPSGAMETHRGNIITLTESDVQACDAGGGCIFATRAQIMEEIEAATKRRAGNCMGSAKLIQD